MPTARAVSMQPAVQDLRFTIATLVNDRAQYDAMLGSFEAGGFSGAACEFIFIDNTRDRAACAYKGLNRLLAEARGTYVIACHQDVRLIEDGRARLESVLDELTLRDPMWAVAGNAGGLRPGRLALRITDPHGADQYAGPLPARVVSLDENFLIIKRDAHIGFSGDLSGFHFYGADICLGADILGYSSYVIDFHLEHLSAGKKGQDFRGMEAAFGRKWSRALRPRWIQTTCALVTVAGTRLSRSLMSIAGAPYRRIVQRLPRPVRRSDSDRKPAAVADIAAQ